MTKREKGKGLMLVAITLALSLAITLAVNTNITIAEHAGPASGVWRSADLSAKGTLLWTAEIVNPKDGSAIRRSYSMLDPVENFAIKLEGIDPDSILKVDFYWSPIPEAHGDWRWHLFGTVSGDGVSTVLETDWWNTEDLGWITESGTVIYICAVAYNTRGVRMTDLVEVCVDINSFPICLWDPREVCDSVKGWDVLTLVADLDLASDMIPLVDKVELFMRPGVLGGHPSYNWESWGQRELSDTGLACVGFRRNVWVWNIEKSMLPKGLGPAYEFMVVATGKNSQQGCAAISECAKKTILETW